MTLALDFILFLQDMDQKFSGIREKVAVNFRKSAYFLFFKITFTHKEFHKDEKNTVVPLIT